MKRTIYFFAIIAAIAAFFILFNNVSVSAEEYQVKLSADSVTYDQAKKEITMSGNVRFNYRNTILTGDRAVFNTSTQIGKVNGNVRISEPGSTVTGNSMVVYYKKRFAKITGNVKMVTVKDFAAPGNRKDRLDSGVTTLTSDNLEYNWGTSEGLATGNVKVIQRQRRAYADIARYNGKAEIITLEGNVQLDQGSNNWVKARKAVVDMRREVYSAQGAVSGSFIVSTTGEAQGQSKQATKTGAPPADKVPIPCPNFEGKKIPD